MRPYTPLELAGRNIYVREGCYLCHSQMIRPLRDEVERYGHYSLAAESMYDHPFQWGSKRTGPDLARVGGKYSDDWHVTHLTDPRSIVPQSVMPGYPFLGETDLDTGHDRRPHAHAADRRRALHRRPDRQRGRRSEGAGRSGQCRRRRLQQALSPRPSVRDFDGKAGTPTEMDALIAYLQMLGTLVDFKTLQRESQSALRRHRR